MVRKILNIAGTVILVLLIIIVVLVFYARMSGNVPDVFGYQIFRVSSGSMSPTLEIGDVILSHKVSGADIHEGDIITYNGLQGEFAGKLITHQVTEEPQLLENGAYEIQTQGSAEGTIPDPKITDSQVVGKYLTSLTFLNGIYTFFVSPLGLLVFIFIIVALFGYEIISLILSYKSLDEAEAAAAAEKKANKEKKVKKAKKASKKDKSDVH